MRHVTEELERVDLERATVAGVVAGANELDPAKHRVVSPSRVVDGGVTHREAERRRTRTNLVGSVVPRVGDRDVPLDASELEGDIQIVMAVVVTQEHNASRLILDRLTHAVAY